MIFKLKLHMAVTILLLLLCSSLSLASASQQQQQQVQQQINNKNNNQLELGLVGVGGLKGSPIISSKIIQSKQSSGKELTGSSSSSSSTSSSKAQQQNFMDSLRTKSKLVTKPQTQTQTSPIVSYGTILSKIAAGTYSVATPSTVNTRNYGINYGTNNGGGTSQHSNNYGEIFPDEILSQKLREFVEATRNEEERQLKQNNKKQNQSFSYSSYGGSSNRGFDDSENSEESLLGVETTSINPFEGQSSSEETTEEFGVRSSSSVTPASVVSVQPTSRKNNQLQTRSKQQQTLKQIEIEDEESARRHGLHQEKERDVVGGGKRIKAAVNTKHTIEYRPVEFANLENIHTEPKIIEVEAKSIPLEIHFKSASSRIKLVQSHKSGELNEIERTTSEEEPQRLMHLVRKPIIQEVHEIITPFRRIVQEIRPVMEEIHTVVAHEKESEKIIRHQSKTNELQQQRAGPQQSSNQTHQIDRSQRQQLSPARQQQQQAQLAKQQAQTQQKVKQNQQSTVQMTNKQQTQQQRPLVPLPAVAEINTKQQRVEQKLIKDYGSGQSSHKGYIPTYSSPTSGSTTTSTTKSSTEFWDQQIGGGSDARNAEDSDDLDQEERSGEGGNSETVEIIDGNGDSAIIPAKLMEQMIISYEATFNRKQNQNQNQQSSSQINKKQQQIQPTQKLNVESRMEQQSEQKPTSGSSNNFGWNYSSFGSNNFDSTKPIAQRRNQNQPQQSQQQQQPQQQQQQSYGPFNQNRNQINQNQLHQSSSNQQQWRLPSPYTARIEFNHFNQHQPNFQPNHQLQHHNQHQQQQPNHFNNHFNQHNNNNNNYRY